MRFIKAKITQWLGLRFLDLLPHKILIRYYKDNKFQIVKLCFCCKNMVTLLAH